MTSNNQNQTKQKNQNLIAIAATVGVLLLGAIAWLAYGNITKANKLELTVQELDESNKLRAELETQYNQALADLEAQKTTNQELNTIIDGQKAELEQQKTKIEGMLANKGKLERARKEIEGMKEQVSGYIAQIEKLKADNDALLGVNTQLSAEKASLTSNLQSKEAENQELSATKATLVSEKEVLSGKVNIASVVKMRQVTAVGQKVKGNDKVKDENSAKSVDQVKVCFTTLSNDVVRPGLETFFVRIINPKGETLAIEDMGSGSLTDKKSGQEIRFTQTKEMEYSNEEVQACMVWAPTNASFMKGTYTVEVYNKGYLSGMGAFSLK